MSKEQDTSNRTVAEALRRAALLFQRKSGNQSSTGRASTTQSGLVPPVPSDATKFLNGVAPPAFAQVKDSDLSLSDITTNNVSIAAHGLTPKAPNDATKFLDGSGAWSVPAGGVAAPGALPATVAALGVRISAEQSAMTLVQGDRITQINDISGNGRHFTQAGGSRLRPRLIPAGRYGFPRAFISFDATNGTLNMNAPWTVAQPFTVVVVFFYWAAGIGNAHLYRDTNNGPVSFISGATQWGMSAGTTLQSNLLYQQNIDGMPQLVTAGNAPMASAPAIHIAQFNGATSVLSNNGVEVTGPAGALTLTGTLRIAAPGTDIPRLGLYEFLVFTGALTLAERTALNAYYANLLGISI